MKQESFDSYGYFHGTIPRDCILACTAQGDVTKSVQFWVKKLRFQVPRDRAVAYVREFGAYTAEELSLMSTFSLACFCLWQACCNIKENGEWFGLVH